MTRKTMPNFGNDRGNISKIKDLLYLTNLHNCLHQCPVSSLVSELIELIFFARLSKSEPEHKQKGY